MPPTFVIVGFIVLLIGAYFYDEWKWRVRPREELVEMIRAANWRLHPKALAELRRRGEDVAGFLPRFLPLLLAGSKAERFAAHLVIRKFYPHVAQELSGYSPTADVESCREKVAPVLERYPAPAPTSG